MKKFFIFIAIIFIVGAMAWVAVSRAFHAAEVSYDAAPPKDTDFDGLTDQGEAQIFHTDAANPDTDRDGYLDGAEVLLGSSPLDAQDPAHYIVASPEEPTAFKREIPWPWYVARAAGLEAYLILFLVTVMGVGIYTKHLFKVIRSEDALALHKDLSIFAGLLLVVHIIALLMDAYIKFRIYEVFVPFVSHFKNLYVGVGVIGFYLFVVIIITSLFLRSHFPRQWRLLHYLTYPLFFAGLIHGVFVGTDTQYFLVKIMYAVTGGIGVALVAYRVAYPYFQKKYPVVAVAAHRAAPGVTALELARADGSAFPIFKPGQYVALATYGAKGKPGRKHYFSIASSPNKLSSMRLGVRILGHFTQSIARIKPGEKLAMFGPYGDFTFEPDTMRRVVFIAGGIGITPFLSAIQYAAEKQLANDLRLIYGNRSKSGAAFSEDIKEMERCNPNFKAFFIMTDEKPSVDDDARLFGRVDEAKLRYCVNDIFVGTYFFVCGPLPFMKAAIKILKRCGVAPQFIRREQFYAA